MVAVTLAQALRKDLKGIMEIERQSFRSPWDTLTMFMALDDPKGRNMIASAGGEVVGYCFAQTMSDMLHLINLAVRPSWRRHGVARQLMEDLLAYAVQSQRLFVFLEVRQSNHEAIGLYRTMDFRQVSTLKHYYHDTREDALIMLKRIVC